MTITLHRQAEPADPHVHDDPLGVVPGLTGHGELPLRHTHHLRVVLRVQRCLVRAVEHHNAEVDHRGCGVPILEALGHRVDSEG